MKVQRIAIILLTFLIAVSLPSPELPVTHAIGVANVVVQNVFWGTDPMSPGTVHAGDVNEQLSIVLSNVGDDVARDVSGTLFLTPPIDYTYFANGVQNIAASVTKVAGDMMQGTQFTLIWVLSIESTANSGIYHCNLTLSYKSARELQQINKTVDVDIPVNRGALYIQAVTTNPIKLFPDSYGNQVTVTLANSGTGIAKNVQVYLQLKLPFIPSSSGSTEIFLGNLPAGQPKTQTLL